MLPILERYKQLAGIVESRPAYNIVLDEEEDLRQATEAWVDRLSLDELADEVRKVVAEREELAVQLDTLAALVEDHAHYLRKNQIPDQGHETHAKLAKVASRVAKSPELARKLSNLKDPKKPDPLWHEKHSGLQHGDSPGTDMRSNAARADHARRVHAIAAFHHFHASQAHKLLGNKKRETQHRAAAEAHHKRAATRHGESGSYMVHPETGKHMDWTPVYDKKFVKAQKNKIAKQQKAAMKVWKTKAA